MDEIHPCAYVGGCNARFCNEPEMKDGRCPPNTYSPPAFSAAASPARASLGGPGPSSSVGTQAEKPEPASTMRQARLAGSKEKSMLVIPAGRRGAGRR